MLLLNLGCGGKKLPEHVNVDSDPQENPDVVCDLAGRWPWADSSVDGAVASHLLEHLAGETFFHFLRELYRVCKADALVRVALPWPRHDIFLNDPTHVRPVMPATLILFSRKYVAMMAEQGVILTDFGKRIGVDFELSPTVLYRFDERVDTTDPELDWKVQHLNNIVLEWQGTLRVVK